MLFLSDLNCQNPRHTLLRRSHHRLARRSASQRRSISFLFGQSGSNVSPLRSRIVDNVRWQARLQFIDDCISTHPSHLAPCIKNLPPHRKCTDWTRFFLHVAELGNHLSTTPRGQSLADFRTENNINAGQCFRSTYYRNLSGAGALLRQAHVPRACAFRSPIAAVVVAIFNYLVVSERASFTGFGVVTVACFFFPLFFFFYHPAARYRYGGYVGGGGVIGSGASDILSTYLRNGWSVGRFDTSKHGARTRACVPSTMLA